MYLKLTIKHSCNWFLITIVFTNYYRDKIIPNGRIKSDNIRRNTEGEGVYLGNN